MESEPLENQDLNSPGWAVELCAVVPGVLSFLVLVSWVLQVWHVGTFGAHLKPMSPSTGLCFLFLSVVLLLNLRYPDRKFARIAGLLVSLGIFLFSLSILFPDLLPFGASLEARMLPSGLLMGNIPIGRMSPLSAVSFIAFSLTVVLEGPIFRGSRVFRQGAALLTTGTGLFSFFIIISYAAGAPFLYWGSLNPMAFLTAACFYFASLSFIWLAGPDTFPRSLFEIRIQRPRDSNASWSVQGALGLFFLLTLSIGIPGYSVFQYQIKMAKYQKQEELSAIANLKVGQICSWYHERIQDIETLSHTKEILDHVREFLLGTATTSVNRDLALLLEKLVRINHYERIVLFAADGKPLIWAPSTRKVVPKGGNVNFLKALESKELHFSDLHRAVEGEEGPIHLAFWIPVRDDRHTDGSALGTLMFQIDPNDFLFPLVQTWPTSNKTAETLLVRAEGDEVVFLNELRHRKNSALNLRIPKTAKRAIPAIMAVSGKEGVLEDLDYRGVPVLAAIRSLPGTPWFMVAKVDQDEVYADLRWVALITGALLFVLVLVAALCVGLIWYKNDIHLLQRQMQLDLQRQELADRILHLYRNANDIILLADQTWTIIEANTRALQTYEWRLEDLPRMNLGSLFPDDYREDFESLKTGLNSRGSSQMETVHRTTGGARFPVESSFHMVELGGRQFFQGIIRDITERKKGEEALNKLNAELEDRIRQRTADLEASNRELESFSYSVSHDLRAPLRGIDGWSLALLEDCGQNIDEQGKQYLARVRAEIQRMGHLIDDILSISRVSRVEFHPKSVDLSALALTIIKRLQETDPERVVEVVVEPGLTVQGDERLLEIALTNLLGNAWKFSRPTRESRIEFGRTTETGGPAFFVRDNGVGFNPDYAQKLFGPFQRLHKVSEFPGSGIGLATVQRIIHRHQGRIWAVSRPFQGATFYFTI